MMNNFIKIQTLKTSILLFLLGLTFGLNAQIQVTIEANAISCNGYTDGTAIATVAGGTEPYIYNWSNGQNGATNVGLSEGTYNLTVSDATGASVTASAAISSPEVLVASITFDGDACSSSSGSLAGSATGGTSPYSYTWSNGASGSTVSGLAQGGYYLTATDANGCESVAYYEITAALAVSVSTIDVICNDFCDASAEAIVTGGTAPYSYIWNTGMTGSVAFPLPAGQYCVTVTDGNGCSVNSCGTVAEPTAIETSVTLSGDCDGNSDIGASVTVTGGAPEYSINWSNGATGSNIAGLTPNTTYSVTVTDANGCNDIETFTTPNEPSGLALTTSGENETCAGDNDGSATIVPGGGEAPYNIMWSTGSSSTTINDLAAGNYEVTVSDANGCTGIQTITVAAGTTINVSVESTPSACGNAGTGSITLVASGGMAPYFYMYENGIGDPTSGQVSNLSAGAYNVTVGDAQGCTTVTTVGVDQIAEFTISASATPESCNGVADGTASVVNVSPEAAQPVTYLWDNGSMSASTEGLSAGVHSVTVTDANGCIDVTEVNVAAGVLINLSTLSTPSACGDVGTGSISVVALTGTGPFTYTYENGIGNPDSGQVMNLNAGDYNVTVTDANGCTNTAMVNVDQESEFTFNTTTTNSSCEDVEDGTATIVSVSPEAAQPVTYLWDNGSMEDNAGDVAAGDYIVTVTDANGCTNIETVTVEANDAISAEVVITPGDCTGDMISVNVSASSMAEIDSYTYTVGDETFISSEFTLDIPAGETVTVTLVVENAAGCTGENESTFTAEPFEPNAPETLNACLGEDLMGTASGGDTYEWTSDEDIFIGDTDIATPEINTSTAGEFPAEVTITNAQGCSVTEAVTITVSDTEIMPDPALVSSTQNCDGTTLDFTNANDSADDYEWIFDYPNGETTSESSYEFPESGIYEVALIPTVGCADTVIVEVEVTEPQIAEFTFETNCENGFVVVFTDMSSNPDDITDWNWEINGEMYDEQNPSVEFETAGTIDAILTVSYGDDCDLTTMQPVDVAPFNPTMPVSQLVDCGGGEEMGLFPNANTDYDYEWSPAGGLSNPSAPNPIATVTETTAYMVTITDPETGCTEESQVIVTVPEGLPSPMLGDISLCQSENETADATVAGGVNYTWSDDEDFNNVLSEEAVYGFAVSEIETTYYVLIEDEFGCTTTESFTAGAYPVDFDFGSLKFICEGDVATYELPDGLSVDWGGDDPADTPIFEEDFFVGTITNEANCSLQDTLFAEAVIVTEGLEIDANPDTILLGDVSELFVTPDDRFTYEWDNGGTLNDADIHNPTAKPEETTTYTVTVRDGDGCEGELDIEVVVENNCEPFLYFPNAFTPDDDGLNDVLYVEGLSLDEVFFAIYNRWGEKVYESNDITEGWDGKHKGEIVCPDVYGYYLRVRCTDGNEIFRKGNVSVLR